MSSENTTAKEAPAREPSHEPTPKDAPDTESPAREEARAPSEGSRESASDVDSTAPERSSEPASDDKEQGEISEAPPLPDEAPPGTNPPLPNEPAPDANPPLPSEPAPDASADDGWDYRWDYALSRYVFFNRITGAETLENPRVPAASSEQPEPPAVTGYNPAIHGDYDPNAWYAKMHEEPSEPAQTDPAAAYYDPSSYDATALFNRFTGQHQTEGAGRHSDEAKSRRQMNAYFDVDAAANANNGRSLKAERAGKKPSKNELKFFKEKRRARKEEKRRAWLRD